MTVHSRAMRRNKQSLDLSLDFSFATLEERERWIDKETERRKQKDTWSVTFVRGMTNKKGQLPYMVTAHYKRKRPNINWWC